VNFKESKQAFHQNCPAPEIGQGSWDAKDRTVWLRTKATKNLYETENMGEKYIN